MRIPRDERQRRHAAAVLRVRAALDAIQRAQDCLDRASEALSAVEYGAPTQKRVWKERDRVHQLWYRVRNLTESSRTLLDHDPETRR